MTSSEPHTSLAHIADSDVKVHMSDFSKVEVNENWEFDDPRLVNWPVVYVIDQTRDIVDRKPHIYIGETIHAQQRMLQHLANPEREPLDRVRVVIDPTFNKSAALDFESHLIQWVHADEHYAVENHNYGISDHDYFQREAYHERFKELVERLDDGRGAPLLHRSLKQIENSDLYKLSPFKSPTPQQFNAIDSILERLLHWVKEEPLRSATGTIHPASASPFVVQGSAGTGKTVVAIYLMKLLADIQRASGINLTSPTEAHESDNDPYEASAALERFFTRKNRDFLEGFRFGYVVPQQSLRESIRRVFKATHGLSGNMVLSPMDLARDETYDLLIVDEAHRLSRYAAQPHGTLTKTFKEAHARMFGEDDRTHTQIDWVKKRSRFQLFFIDPTQSIRTADVTPGQLNDLREEAEATGHYFELSQQMRVKGGASYVRAIRAAITGGEPEQREFGRYDFRIYDDPEEMRRAVLEQDGNMGLCRMLAGYAWPWKTRKKEHADEFDIEIGSFRMRWNSTDRDWVASKRSLHEVGSIHTIQGYDLNVAGVIIGPDLCYDPETGSTFFVRSNYHDQAASKNLRMLGQSFTDDDLRIYVENIYSVLLTRGIRGTYVHAVDPALHEHLKELFPSAVQRSA